jgi:cytochrome c oxidase subunit 2
LARAVAALLAVLAPVVLVACNGEPYPQSSLHPASDGAEHIDGLFRQILFWAAIVFVIVEGLILYAVIKFRARPGSPDPRQIHGNTTAELAWTLAPAVILVFIAVPTIKTIFAIDGRAVPEGALEVEVIGHQWWWEFRYPSLNITTANEMHLPADRPVRLTMTSVDVIHAFWVPRLMGKRDMIMGRNTRLVFTPDSVATYMGQCAEFCGISHANMRFRVMVNTAEDFDAWVARHHAGPVATDTTDALIAAGEATFRRIRQPASNSCIVCHAIQGVSAGVLGPNLSHVGSRTTIAGGLLPNDSASMARWLGDPLGVKPGSLMPQIGLTNEEIAALVAYLHGKQ